MVNGQSLQMSTPTIGRTWKHRIRPQFQLLIYPFLDARNNSESARRFTDTPMWNSKRTEKVNPIVNPDNAVTDKRMTSSVEVEDLTHLPEAYIETAEFDCLHDDGMNPLRKTADRSRRGCGAERNQRNHPRL